MTGAKVVRYTTKPESADENQRLVEAVYAELADSQPTGFRYATLRLDDGVSFVHVAVLEGDENPLQSSVAFAEFQAGIKDRCVVAPEAVDATIVGSYRLLS